MEGKPGGPFIHWPKVLVGVVAGGLVAAIAVIVTNAFMSWQRGIYAGFHYNDAKQYVQDIMAWNYGLEHSKMFRLGVPDVVNTHAGETLYNNGGQVREFHLIGPAGVKWCISVWGGGADWTKDYAVVKGCAF